MSKNSKTETTTQTPAAILVAADAASKAGNAPSMTDLNAALAEAESHAGRNGAKGAPKMLQGVSPATWALLAQNGPVATGQMTQGHRRFLKGLLPRLPQADAAKVRAILTHYKVTL